MPAGFGRSFRISAGALASILTLTSVAPTGVPGFVSRAQAQAPGPQQEQIDFDAALEGYGHWVQHPRLGEVWVPDNVPQDWQPYRIGHWLYTDEWGWYWNSDEPFGWVTYHYGRWYLDRETGWIWIPNDEWGPAWVNWRQGDNFVGWAPTPPDEFVDDDESYADSYMFVRAGDLMAPEVYTVFIPYRERRDYYYRSTLVNRTIYFADRRGAVNPGIPPAYIASATGRPFHSSLVAPIVIAGTIGVVGAVILHNNFRDRSRTRIQVRESNRIYQPGERFQRMPGLNKGERGRLGNNAPLAARGGNPVLQLNSQAKTQGQRQFGPRTGGPQQGGPQIQSKQINPNNPQPPKNWQQNVQPNAVQQKSITTNPADNNRGKQFDGNRQNFERKNFEQKKFEQKNSDRKSGQPQNMQRQNNQQQNNQPQFQKKSGPTNTQQNNNPPRGWQQNNAPRQNIQQQQQIQRQNTQQHNSPPRVQQQAPKPQPAKPAPQPNNNKDKKNN
jgi:hypothetical protein